MSKKTKISTMTKVTAIILLITMIALTIISGTFAKYTSELTGDDTATVAKWEVALGEADKTFDLFTNVYDLNGVTNKNDLSGETGTDEKDVVTGRKVAPGTWGKTEIKVTNKSEVTAEATITITGITNTITPLQFSTDGQNWKTSDKVSELTYEKLQLPIGSTTEQSDTVNLYWKWDFEDATQSEANDTTDTDLGKDATATCKVEMKAVVTQVD